MAYTKDVTTRKGKKKGYRRKRASDSASDAAATASTSSSGTKTAGRLSGFQAERKAGLSKTFTDAKAKLAAAKASGDKDAAHAAHAEIKTARKARKGYVADKKAAKKEQRGGGKKNKKSS